ncbi:WXG100 family type VII secretion target [Tsukamurella sp. DT100]|uniref:WXG100 family type VII secretion target n=1 Tax=Tsukamurella sp. DT100 TaxID=3393415 RepID=UPI003CECC223
MADPVGVPVAPDTALDPAIRALLDRPVNEVLAALGLPPVPTAPDKPPQQDLPAAPKGVPEAPQVPGFDVAGLVKPMTDLLSTFGSGSFEGLDPSAALSGASKALEQGASMGMQAISQLSSVWQGPAATAATGKGVEAATGTGLVAEQGAELSTAVGEAATVVGTGEAELQAIIDSFMAVISALGPSLWLPPGQAAAVAAAQEHLAHATEVVARTKSQLSGLSAQVGAAGRKVPVATPPTTAATAAAQAAASIIPGVVSAATGAVTAVGKLATDTVSGAVKTAVGVATSAGEALSGLAESATETEDDAATSTETTATDDFPSAATLTGGGTGGGGSGTGGVGVGGLGSGVGAAATLSQPQSAAPAARTPLVEGGARTVPASSDVVSRGGMAAPMMPMGAAGAAGARGASAGDHAVPDYLVTSDNGESVLGDLPLVGPQVVGDALPAEQYDEPDVELRL